MTDFKVLMYETDRQYHLTYNWNVLMGVWNINGRIIPEICKFSVIPGRADYAKLSVI